MVQAALVAIPVQAAHEIRTLALLRLNHITKRLWPQIVSGDRAQSCRRSTHCSKRKTPCSGCMDSVVSADAPSQKAEREFHESTSAKPALNRSDAAPPILRKLSAAPNAKPSLSKSDAVSAPERALQLPPLTARDPSAPRPASAQLPAFFLVQISHSRA